MKAIWEKISAKIGKKYLVIILVAIVVLGTLVYYIADKKNSAATALPQ